MEEIKGNYIDKDFMQLQKELDKIELEAEDRVAESKKLKWFPSIGFALDVPAGFLEADREKSTLIYFSKNRPDLVLIYPSAHAGLTFQTGILENKTYAMDLYHERERMCQILSQADGKNVFYDQGNVTGNLPVVWFDYKSFAGAERVYNMMFLILSNGKLIIGSFNCIFKDYEKWRPVILKMLKTIQTEEDNVKEYN
ncbi:hypothetical protein RZO55_21375 [Clostridium boliviensis]|uniref:DUF1795 domain-containing protein n=1 Tax=Clostridium boliviensis TaxID=318465 RepID=A0ABU4GT65_9CLOT|nr:hypothetical protein [Clostridium boliviensis]MDW2800128.1 hypothetical protein [Clostridium boliviensis]